MNYKVTTPTHAQHTQLHRAIEKTVYRELLNYRICTGNYRICTGNCTEYVQGTVQNMLVRIVCTANYVELLNYIMTRDKHQM